MLPTPVTVLIATLNHLLYGNDWARQRLASYAGKQALINLSTFQFGFVITDKGDIGPVIEPLPDVTIHMPADSPVRLLEGFEHLMGAARVEGNAEFATELSFVFRNLRWDAAEDLSRIFGDIAAQRMVHSAHQFIAWQKQIAGNLLENINEYLAFENHTLITRTEFMAFSSDLSQLENRLSRLELRAGQSMPSRQRRLL